METIDSDLTIVKKLIITSTKRRGNGKTTPIRVITEIFSMSGHKIAEFDPCAPNAEKIEFLLANKVIESEVLTN